MMLDVLRDKRKRKRKRERINAGENLGKEGWEGQLYHDTRIEDSGDSLLRARIY